MYKYLYYLLFIAIATQANAQVHLSSGLIAYYPFSGDFKDASGSGHDGVSHGVTLTVDEWGNPNSAAYFDSSSYIEVPASPTITPSSSFTICYRFNTLTSAGQVMFSKSDFSVAPNDLQFQIGFGYTGILGKPGFFFQTQHTGTCITPSYFGTDYLITNDTIQTNKWYCVIMTFDNGVKSTYVNGVLDARHTVTGTSSDHSIDSCSGGTFRIGVWWANDPEYYYGKIDEVRLYNRVLNTFEIDSLCGYVQNKKILTVGDSQISCKTLKFTAASNYSITSYYWDFGDGKSATGNPAIHTYISNGTYSVKLITVDSAGNRDTAISVININNSFTLQVNSDTSICKGDTAQLFVTGGISYTWSPTLGLNDSSIFNPLASPDQTTTYVVTSTDSEGCLAKDSVTVSITNSPPLRIWTNGNVIDCNNSAVQLFVIGAAKYKWSPENFCNSPSSSDPIVSPNTITKFTVVGYNDNQTCISTDSITVLVENDTAFIPNAFTPNGDGLNDIIYPIVSCDFHFDGFYVFNRWGNEVFYTSVYKRGWDGTYNGGLAENGVYFYFIKGHKSDGTPLIQKGNITLIR